MRYLHFRIAADLYELRRATSMEFNLCVKLFANAFVNTMMDCPPAALVARAFQLEELSWGEVAEAPWSGAEWAVAL